MEQFPHIIYCQAASVPIYAFLDSFDQFSAQYCLLLSHITVLKQWTAVRERYPIPLTTMNPLRLVPEQVSNQRPPILKSCTLPTERGSRRQRTDECQNTLVSRNGTTCRLCIFLL